MTEKERVGMTVEGYGNCAIARDCPEEVGLYIVLDRCGDGK
jgi:hypothetical protein